ncbi:hypothetical protein U1Q18_046137, partial [Sarracenia purpurea var. burkii]
VRLLQETLPKQKPNSEGSSQNFSKKGHEITTGRSQRKGLHTNQEGESSAHGSGKEDEIGEQQTGSSNQSPLRSTETQSRRQSRYDLPEALAASLAEICGGINAAPQSYGIDGICPRDIRKIPTDGAIEGDGKIFIFQADQLQPGPLTRDSERITGCPNLLTEDQLQPGLLTRDFERTTPCPNQLTEDVSTFLTRPNQLIRPTRPHSPPLAQPNASTRPRQPLQSTTSDLSSDPQSDPPTNPSWPKNTRTESPQPNPSLPPYPLLTVAEGLEQNSGEETQRTSFDKAPRAEVSKPKEDNISLGTLDLSQRKRWKKLARNQILESKVGRTPTSPKKGSQSQGHYKVSSYTSHMLIDPIAGSKRCFDLVGCEHPTKKAPDLLTKKKKTLFDSYENSESTLLPTAEADSQPCREP